MKPTAKSTRRSARPATIANPLESRFNPLAPVGVAARAGIRINVAMTNAVETMMAWIRNDPPVETNPITVPAIVGPTTRDKLIPALIRPIAFESSSRSTRFGVIDCCVGIRIACRAPVMNDPISKCHGWTNPVRTSIASASATIAEAHWTVRSRRRRST